MIDLSAHRAPRKSHGSRGNPSRSPRSDCPPPPHARERSACTLPRDAQTESGAWRREAWRSRDMEPQVSGRFFFATGELRILRHQDLVHRAVASLARRRLRVAIFCSLGVDAGSESFHLVVMASRAELRSKSRSRQRFMRRPVATIACLRPQQRMHALRHIGGLLRMAGGAEFTFAIRAG